MLWIKALHIIAMTCWFAALFYLPRLFVYHSMSEDRVSRDRFVIMERKLFWGIGTPAMLATLIFGGWLLHYFPAYSGMSWMHIKLALVILAIIYHHLCLVYMKQLASHTCKHSHEFFRAFNEVPVFFLAGIILLVVIKPF